jgi:hypothetical protein
MLKLDILIVRRPDTTHDQFVEYWRDRHAPFFVSQPIVKKNGPSLCPVADRGGYSSRHIYRAL